MKATHLGNAPITEALIDFRVEPADGMTHDRVAAIQDLIGVDYPNAQPRYRLTQHLAVSSEQVSTSGARELDGYFYASIDRRRVVQVQPSSFTLSILRPYDRWEELRDEARRRWEDYVKVATPKRVVRIAARYINRIEIPQAPADLKEWFHTYPELGRDLPQLIGEYLMRVVVPLAKGFGIVTLASEASNSDKIIIVLDIDVFRQAEFTPTSEILWAAVDELRSCKNDLFFGSITERTGELYR